MNNCESLGINCKLLDESEVCKAMKVYCRQVSPKACNGCRRAFELGRSEQVSSPTKTGYWEFGSWEDGHWVNGNTRCRCTTCGRDFPADNQNIWKACPHCMSVNTVR